MSEESREPKERVRRLIEALRAGADPEKVKAEFKDILGGMESPDITVIEDELVADGLPPEEIHRLCDVHLAVFKEATEKAKVEVLPGIPFTYSSKNIGSSGTWWRRYRGLSRSSRRPKTFQR